MSPSKLAPSRQCIVCNSTENPLRCSVCQAVWYCGPEHQTADYATHHKAICKRIKKAQVAVSTEEDRLRNLGSSAPFTPPNVFETHVGHFWGIHETRPYMRNRFGLVEALLQLQTVDAVEAALAHFMDMLRLCRGDNMGVRSQVPALMLRLGKDQQCYDFIKWWKTCDPDGTYDWGDLTLPYLNIVDADVFEPCDVFLGKYGDLAHLVALTLLKIRLLTGLQALENIPRYFTDEVPQEIIDLIGEETAGPTIRKRVATLSSDERAKLIVVIRGQVKSLYERVEDDNPHFWPALINPGRHLSAAPQPYSSGSVEEMQLVLNYSYRAWVETEGSIRVVETLKNPRTAE